jgi:trehalose 2-sulfotransferase
VYTGYKALMQLFGSKNKPSNMLYPSASDHQRDIEKYFGPQLLRELNSQEKELFKSTDIFFVLFTNRSGSNYLCELLGQRGLGIKRAEPFNRGVVINQSGKRGFNSYVDYFSDRVANHVRNGNVGFKISAEQLFWLTSIDLLSRFRSVRILTIRRQDILAQAVSHYLARETGKWHSQQEGDKPVEDVPYNSQEIMQSLWNITRGHQLAKYYQAVHGVPALDTYYEDLLAQPDRITQDIASFLGADEASLGELKPGRVSIKKQRSKINQQMREKFETEYALNKVTKLD